MINAYKQIKFNFLMNKTSSDDSQNQGFHENQICIDSHNRKEQTKQQKNSKKFQPRYISGYGILRKQPKQSYEMVSDIPLKDPSFSYISSDITYKTQLPSAFEVYHNLNQYTLIYSRNKEAFATGYRSTFQNQINLKAQHQKDDTFKVLKDFDEKSILQQKSSDTTLIFDSRFESGNLLCAFKQKRQGRTYNLFMSNDTNTYGYNQWFYFSIRNARKNTKYTFKIVNYRKSYSLFKLGLKPLVFSLKKAKETGNGWHRDGQSISYYRSKFSEAGCTPYFTLQFSLQFQYDNDYITLSPYAPYSYSRLMKSLQTFEKKAQQNQLIWKIKSIAHSLTKTQIPYITVTNHNKPISSKQNIVIFARQHSGQTWSSFLAQEIMKQIVEQKTQYCKWLTENYVVRIFPMVNVDGVIYGNFRCDLAGYDLNRTWKSPYKSIHPQIYIIKDQLQKLHDRQGILFCLDLHTHSKQFGAFAYCCVQSQKGRQLPVLLSKIMPIFRYPACTFGISAEKESTARASVFHLTKNINIITIQLSAFGFHNKVSKNPIMFSPYYMSMIAKSILYGYYCYSFKKQPSVEEISIICSKSQLIPNNLVQQEAAPVQGSDSQPQADQIQIKVRIDKIFPDQFKQDIFTTTAITKNKNVMKKKLKKLSNNTFTKPAEQKMAKKFKLNNQKKDSNKTQAKPLSFASCDSVGDKDMVLVSPIQKQAKSQFQKPLYKKTKKLYAQKSMKSQMQKSKPLNQMQFSMKKLPIVPPQEKVQPTINFMMDESFPVVGGVGYMKQTNAFNTFSTYDSICKPRVRINSRKIAINKQKNNRLQQQLPYLCIMSQNKRLLLYENMKDNKSSEQIPIQQRTFHNSILNGLSKQRNAPIIKLKSSQKYPGGDLITRINDEFARYDQFINSRKHRN